MFAMEAILVQNRKDPSSRHDKETVNKSIWSVQVLPQNSDKNLGYLIIYISVTYIPDKYNILNINHTITILE